MGVLFSFCASFYLLKVIFSFDTLDQDGFLIVVSFVFFLNIFTFGLGRPLYSDIRLKRERQNIEENSVAPLILLVCLPILGILGYAIMCIGYIYIIQGYDENTMSIFSFCISLGIFYSGIFQRDYFYAIDREATFEKYELYRKFALLLGLVVLSTTSSHLFFLFIAVTAFLTTYLSPIYPLFRHVYHAKYRLSVVPYTKNLFQKGKFYFVFMLVELGLYNLPLLIFTITQNLEAVAVFSVWQRLFQICVLPSRIFTDSMVNTIIQYFIKGLKIKCKTILLKTMIFSTILTIFVLLILSVTLSTLIKWLNPDLVNDQVMLLIAATVWACANSMHHTFGSFLVSCGSAFKEAMNSSVITLGSMAIAGAVFTLFGLKPLSVIIALGLVYSLRLISVINLSLDRLK